MAGNPFAKKGAKPVKGAAKKGSKMAPPFPPKKGK